MTLGPSSKLARRGTTIRVASDRRFSRLLIFALIAAGPTPFEATAHAQTPTDRANEVAQEAFRLNQENRTADAIAKYGEALKLNPDLHGARFHLARLYAASGRFEDSRREFAFLVLTNPDDSAARRAEVAALLFLDRWAEARRKLEEGLTALPRDGQLAHLLARLLACAPADEVRDGVLAMELAIRVYEVKRIPEVAQTLAMAFAEAGEFDKAVEVQKTLVQDAENEEALPEMKERLALYEAGQPFRASSPTDVVTSADLPGTR